MTLFKKTTPGLFLGGFIALLYLLYFQYNEGFVIGELRSNVPYYQEFDIAQEEDRQKMAPCLDQPFRYLGKGCQFYVFESQDGQYVLKFFKHKHLRTSSVLSTLPLPSYFKAIIKAKNERRKERAKQLFASCCLGYKELKEESGLEFIHLHRQDCFEKKVTLINKVGLFHTIDLDRYEFLIQKKAIPAKKCFEELIAKGEEGEIRDKLEQLLDLIVVTYQKGIMNTDRAVVQNIGFRLDGSRALLLDVGLIQPASIGDRVSLKEEIVLRLENMHDWTLHHLPELTIYIENRAKEENYIVD